MGTDLKVQRMDGNTQTPTFWVEVSRARKDPSVILLHLSALRGAGRQTAASALDLHQLLDYSSGKKRNNTVLGFKDLGLNLPTTGMLGRAGRHCSELLLSL